VGLIEVKYGFEVAMPQRHKLQLSCEHEEVRCLHLAAAREGAGVAARTSELLDTDGANATLGWPSYIHKTSACTPTRHIFARTSDIVVASLPRSLVAHATPFLRAYNAAPQPHCSSL
jgi:hypothetical protein